MDNLEPITRNEMFLNGDDLEPITREEMILAGADLEPITRHEWFLKKYRGGGGGGGYDLVNIPNLPADIASFNDGTDLPMASLKVTVTPYQDLHGYDNPWVGGAGQNLLNVGGRVNQTSSEIRYTSDDNYIILNGTKNGGGYATMGNLTLTLPAGTYYAKAFVISGTTTGTIDVYVNNGTEDITSSLIKSSEQTITLESETTLRFRFAIWSDGTVLTNYTVGIVVSKTSGIDKFYPYSNICPIIGWDEAVVTVADDAESPTTSHEYTIDLDGTRYGGVLDATNGTMDDTLDYIASYNGETLPSTWISDRDVYAEGTTPTIGAEVVYTRTTPITVQLAPTPVKSLEGENNIFANCGQITEVKYFKKA